MCWWLERWSGRWLTVFFEDECHGMEHFFHAVINMELVSYMMTKDTIKNTLVGSAVCVTQQNNFQGKYQAMPTRWYSQICDSWQLWSCHLLFLVGYHLHAKPQGEDYHLCMPIHAEHHSLYVCTLYIYIYIWRHSCYSSPDNESRYQPPQIAHVKDGKSSAWSFGESAWSFFLLAHLKWKLKRRHPASTLPLGT